MVGQIKVPVPTTAVTRADDLRGSRVGAGHDGHAPVDETAFTAWYDQPGSRFNIGLIQVTDCIGIQMIAWKIDDILSGNPVKLGYPV